MFNKLDRKKKSFWSPWSIGAALLVEAGIALLIMRSGMSGPLNKKSDELVDYVEVEQNKPKAPEPPPPPPPPPPPETPDAPPPVAKGFQELVPPVEPPREIPKVDPNQVAVNANDFSGVGKAGGSATGSENGVQQSTEQRTAAPDEGTYELSAVEEQPSLSNSSEVQRQLARNYPPLLRDAGVIGTVTLRMRVLEDGHVDPESISVENTTHDAFADAAKRVVEKMRFRPAKVGGHPVKVWVTLPVTFQLQT
ncbi:TonB family protein [Longimicrobium sp.]|uniref:energy transducer TonB n=1 Tax=Longimicrobium sp. TaxID=2029185 RepID=UPI002C14EFE2|nr:TonB family protein [Longimicrobium sp.]HSU16901.1 TonB family protein [Longimicrobium sp.]